MINILLSYLWEHSLKRMRKNKKGLSRAFRRQFVFCIIMLGLLWSSTFGGKLALGQKFKNQGEHEIKREGMEMTGPDRLTDNEGKHLLSVARKTIEQRLVGPEDQPLESELSTRFLEHRGTFVTLTSDGNLRGCIGHIIPREPMIEGIRENAVNAAFRDPRFPPLTKAEWEKIKIEISILTDPKPLPYSDADDLLSQLRPHIDGVIIKKGYCQAVFLPQVWEQLPKKEDFLSHLCLKASLGSNAWEKGDLEVSTYQVQAFEE